MAAHNQFVKNSSPFMELECLIPCSQEPTTGPYSEPDESSPHSPTRSINIILLLPVTFYRSIDVFAVAYQVAGRKNVNEDSLLTC